MILTFCTKKSTSPEEQLLPPTDLTISLVENNKIQINWVDNSTNETAYLIDRKMGTFNWLENLGEVAANITSFTDNIPTNSDTVFSYRIRAFDDENYSAYSDTIAWFSINSAPSSLQLEQIAQDSIKLTWQDNSIGEEYFRIDRKIDEKGWQMDYAHVPADTTHFLDYTTALYDTCNYKVFAVSGISHSDSTENAFIPFLPAPSNLELQALGATEVKLTWKDNCHNEEGYRLFIKRGETAVWDSLNLPENTEIYSDENVIPGVMNYYKICAYYENDTSGFIEDEINTLPAPNNLICTQRNVHTFELTWNDNSEFEQGFKIDRKIDFGDWTSPLEITEPNATTWIDSTVGRNFNAVYYRLYAYYALSSSDSIYINSNIAFPAPKDFEYEKLTIQSIKLTWDDYSQGETGFKIDKKVGVGIGEWQIQYAIVGENIQEWTDENAEINDNLMYRIHAYCGNNVSDYATSQEIDNTFPAPTDISYQKIDIATIKLNWTDNSVGEQGFKIDKKVGEGDWEIEYANLNADIVQWFDWTAEINEMIQYRVYAYYEDSVSDYVITYQINNTIPAPTGLSYHKIDIHTIKLEWTDNSIGEQGFKIDKKIGENEWQINFADVDDNIEEWTDENAEINELIKYRVYAYFTNYLSGYSTTNEIDNSLPAPTNFNYEIISPTSIRLSWNDNSIGEQGFKIDKKESNQEWVNEFAILNNNITEYIDIDVDFMYNLSYLYRVYSFYNDQISTKVQVDISNVFKKTFGGSELEFGNSVEQTNDGGFIITCRTESYGAAFIDLWLIKTDVLGNEEWNKIWGGSEFDEGKSVKQTDDGGFIITGLTSSYGAGSADVLLLKTDALGNEEWYKTFGGSSSDVGYSVEQTEDDGFIITGNISTNVCLIKTDANGNEEWSKTFGDTYDDRGYSVVQTVDGGYVITGYKGIYYNYNYDVWLIKTDANGNEEWNKTFGGSDPDWGYSVVQTNDAGFIITGYTQSFGSGARDVWLIKTDENGSEEWNKTFGGSTHDEGFSVQQTYEGGFIITGYTQSYGAGSADVLLLKTDALGNEQWNKTFGGSSSDEGNSVVQIADDGFIIIGRTSSYGAGSADVWLIKTDEEGNVE